ncbi:MAG: FG-GAP repeat protein [Planctomycetes bacterium]|nr:FG-GAP repeat protein [Planctomycetota bacterium]
MRSLRFRLAYSLSLTVAGLTALTMGGCPVAQTPRTPADNANANTSTTTGGSDASDQLTRPIPPVVVDDSTTSSSSQSSGGSNNTNTNSGGGGDGGGGGTSGTVFVSVSAPTAAVRTRPGTIVNVQYEISNASGALQSSELVVAADSDNNSQPDGEPVFSRTINTVAGLNTVPLDTNELVGQLANGFGRFVLGVRATTVTNEKKTTYALGNLTLDSIPPTGGWVLPADDAVVSRSSDWTIQLTSTDNASHTVRVLLDPDDTELNGNEFEFMQALVLPAGTGTRTVTSNLATFPPNTYRYYVMISDGIAPEIRFYAANAGGTRIQIAITNRIIGTFDLNSLTNSTQGGILQGFNFNDLAGSSITNVPDLNGDGRSEMLIASRWGKPSLIQNSGVGFGEAYLIYGSGQRITGQPRQLNSVGRTISGLIFPGIRTPRNADIAPQNESTRWTKGLSDVTVVQDMDGDNLPELVFSFPRAEAINLGEENPTIQHPELAPDLGGMGDLEYNAFYGMPPVWHPSEAQFTRGGVVIVSSHNEMLRNPTVLSRKADRVFDLHEAGQLFSGMARPGLIPYIRQGVPRNQLDGQGRAAQFNVCADCDFQPPDGWEPGDLGDPMDPTDDQPGACGDDGCGYDATWPEDNPYTGNIHDGREEETFRWFLKWDVVFENQGPGGFLMPWTIPPMDPPLVNPSGFPYGPLIPFPFGFYPNVWYPDFCGTQCEITNEWYSWAPTLPGTILGGTSSWDIAGNPMQTPTDCYPNNPPGPFEVDPEEPCFDPPQELCPPPDIDVSASGTCAWTGFYAPGVSPWVGTATGEVFPTPIGARVMGQKVDDEFGTTVASDGTWLYVSAPIRTANDAPYDLDVPSLAGSRSQSGIVYQIRTDARLTPNGVTRTQLWMERGTRDVPGPNPEDPPTQVALSWPNIDNEDPNRTDYTMPVPHTYMVEGIGSVRGNPAIGRADRAFGADQASCPPGYDPSGGGGQQGELDDTDQPAANAINAYRPYPVGTAGYYMDRTPQIVGPHDGALLSYVRGLGDINGDGVRDFAVGSEHVRQDVETGGGQEVGAVFIVYGRPTGVEGDYLLEDLARDVGDPNRLRGVLLRGTDIGETFGRVFDDAGDFNGDGSPDVIVGNEGINGGAGEAIIVLGSSTLLSPADGWTTADAVAAGRAIRLAGVSAGDLVGANVAGAGDVDGDGIGDVLVAAPGAAGGKGIVYLIYGSRNLTGTVNLAQVGTIGLQGVKFIGRAIGDFVGAGSKTINNTDPNNGNTNATSRGLARLGDIDGDGKGDFAIGSMLASPNGQTNAGEVYILYGRGN